MQDFGTYVHVPWCRIHCPYCSFYVIPGLKERRFQAYLHEIKEQHRRLRPQFSPQGPRTLYFGGGTPSQLPVQMLATLIEDLVGPHTTEITVEVNPEDVTQSYLNALLGAGVTRLSVGIQTFDKQLARPLGRGHTEQDLRRSIDLIQRAGFKTWSMDLMFALPDQDAVTLQTDLKRIAAIKPPHVSLYALSIERSTALARQVQKGLLTPPGDDQWRSQLDQILTELRKLGYQRYEVSNFAISEEHESEHNWAYWTALPILALGPSAAGLLPDGVRTTNPRTLRRWLSGEPPAVEPWTAHRDAHERLVTQLRTRRGLNLTSLATDTELMVDMALVKDLIKNRYATVSKNHLILSDQGLALADQIATRLSTGLTKAI